MVYFCPNCCNLLFAETGSSGTFRMYCNTCPYIFTVSQKISKKVEGLEKKKVDDIIGEEAWKNVDQTTARCDKCGNDRAYYMQMQTRSADEPMTIFYRCTNSDCNYQWREG